VAGSDADAIVDRQIGSLVAIYQKLHAHPELSHQERETSALLAGELRQLGFSVTERVGRYANEALQSYGVVGVLENGAGPRLLVRADMDALPVTEQTGLPYASRVRTKDEAGQEVGVMHACGHDVHVTALIGTARALVALRTQWHGTLVLVGQPAEERIDGALAMLRDRLYERFGKPDFALALHDDDEISAGRIGLTPGYALATSTSADILVRGVGTHGSKPQQGKDPVVLAARIVLALQTIVSRENSPFEPAVVTVGTIHGGTKRNIIPEEVKLELSIRTYKEEIRQRILEAVRRIARGEAIAAGMPDDRAPVVTVNEAEFAPAMYNDPALVARLAPVLRGVLGAENVLDMPPRMASEDFGRFGAEGKIPITMIRVGAVDPAKLAEAEKTGRALPSLHSPLFAPLPEPTLRTGVRTMTAAALELLR
jgi:hippurate hydrolase